MRHWSVPTLLAAVVVGLLIVLLRGEATAQEGELSGSLPFQGGFSLNVWSGGSADDLLATAEANGCRTRSFFANRPGGGLVGYFPTPIAIVNRDFLEVYPGGVLPPQTPVIVVCNPGGTPPPIATPTPTPTATPTETPAANQPPTIADLAFSSNSLTGTLTASVTDEDGEVTSVTIEWGDGNESTVTGDFANISTTHRYGDKGSYTVRLTAVDDRAGSAAESREVSVTKVVRVLVDDFLFTSTNFCDNFDSTNEFSGSVTLSGTISTLINFSINTPPASDLPLGSLTFSQDLSVTASGGGAFSVSGRLIELDGFLEGADDDLGSFSRSFNADVPFGFLKTFSQTLTGDGCSAIIEYRVRMNIQ